MGNAPIGSNFIEGPLGVVVLEFDGVDLGKTRGGTQLEFIEDMKEIKYDQMGTQPADKIPTGQAYRITTKLAEPTWTRLRKLMRGLTVMGDNAKLGRDIYRSGFTNFAKVLKVRRVDSDGVASTNAKFMMTFWKAIPSVSGSIGEFTPDAERDVQVVFDCIYDETVGHEGFGFSGYASSLGIY